MFGEGFIWVRFAESLAILDIKSFNYYIMQPEILRETSKNEGQYYVVDYEPSSKNFVTYTLVKNGNMTTINIKTVSSRKMMEIASDNTIPFNKDVEIF